MTIIKPARLNGNAMILRAALAAAGIAVATTAPAETPDKWVSYVESTGSQYVNTGIDGRHGTKIEARVEWMELADASFVSSRKEDWPGNGRLYFCYCQNDKGEMYTASDTGSTVMWNTEWNCRWEKNRVYDYTAEFSAPDNDGNAVNSIVVDGLKVWSKASAALDTGYPLFVFANNQRGSANSFSKTRCYGLKIWQDGALVRDFQPCMKDGRAGLYDAVSQTIFYSGSAPDLVCDEDSEVPDEFIEYVESQGEEILANSQRPAYIDTGIIGKSGTKMSGEFAILNSEDKGFLGSRAGNDRFYMLQSFNSKITCGYGTHKENSNTLTLGKKYWVETELNPGSQVQKIGADGSTNTVYSAADTASIDTGYPLHLFACNVDGTPTWFSKARCYGFKMWQDGVLVRDFRPCLKNGVAGLYDDVSKRIFYSLGTPLSAETRRTVKAKNVVFVEYIESDGTSTLDTGVPARSGIRAAGDMAWTAAGDYGDGKLRVWNHETYRYLENTVAPGVWYRQHRTYLGAANLKSDTRFLMVHEFDSALAPVYGSDAPALADGVESSAKTLYAGRKFSFDVTFAVGAQSVELDGTETFAGADTAAVDTGDTLHLFSQSGWRYRSAARCYGLKIWQDGALVRDFLPCRVDGKGMLYDKVTETLYRPSPDIPAERTGPVVFTGDEKPAQYIEYVESDGTVFVDTGVVGKSGTKAEMEMSFLENGDKGFLESRNGNSRYYLFHNGNSKAMYGYGNWYYVPAAGGAGTQDSNAGFAMTNGQKYHVESLMAAGTQSVKINRTQLLTGSASETIDTGYNLYLFTCHMNGTPQYSGKGRIYWLKLWQGDADGGDMQLVRNFRPVKLANGLVVLWDFVNDKPYLPQSVTDPYGQAEFPAVGPDGEPLLSPFVMIVR